MPITTGQEATATPLGAESPDGPGAFLTIAQKLRDLTEPLASIAALPATGNYAGRQRRVLTTPGAHWEHDGTSWRMRGEAVFASAGARDSAIAAPAQGMLAFLSDVEYSTRYDGAAWRIVGVQACSVRKSAGQNLTTGAVALTWDVETADAAGMHDNSSNNSRIYARRTGLHEVTLQVYNNNSSGLGTIHGRVNGASDVAGSQVRRTGAAGEGTPLLSVFPVFMTAGDYIEGMALHSTAAGQAAGGSSLLSSSMTVKFIGPA